MSSGETYDLDWALETFLDETGYTIAYEGFKTADPKIVAIDKWDVKAADAISFLEMLAERYAACVDVEIDSTEKSVTVRPGKELVYVESEHTTNSTYVVEGKEPYSLVTQQETRQRYFCVFDRGLVNAEWQKRAFETQFQMPYLPFQNYERLR